MMLMKLVLVLWLLVAWFSVADSLVCEEMLTDRHGLSKCFERADKLGVWRIELPPAPNGLEMNPIVLKNVVRRGSDRLVFDKTYTIQGNGVSVYCKVPAGGTCIKGDATAPRNLVPSVVLDNLNLYVRGEEANGIWLHGHVLAWVFRDFSVRKVDEVETGTGLIFSGTHSCNCHHRFEGKTGSFGFRTAMWLSGHANAFDADSLHLAGTETGLRCEPYPGTGDTMGGSRSRWIGPEIFGKIGIYFGKGCNHHTFIAPIAEYSDYHIVMVEGAKQNLLIGPFGRTLIHSAALKENMFVGMDRNTIVVKDTPPALKPSPTAPWPSKPAPTGELPKEEPNLKRRRDRSTEEERKRDRE